MHRSGFFILWLRMKKREKGCLPLHLEGSPGGGAGARLEEGEVVPVAVAAVLAGGVVGTAKAEGGRGDDVASAVRGAKTRGGERDENIKDERITDVNTLEVLVS